MIRGLAGSAHFKKALAAPLRVSIEQNFLGSAGPLDAAKDRVLAALVVAGIIKPHSILAGNLGIVFLDPPAHFLDERGAQPSERREHGRRVAVLGLDHCTNIAGQGGGGAQNFLPVRGLQPPIIVAQRNPMQGSFRAALFGGWRGRGAGRPLKLAHPSFFLNGAGGATPCTAWVRQGPRALALRYSRALRIFQRFFCFNAIKCMHCYLRKPSVALRKASSS